MDAGVAIELASGSSAETQVRDWLVELLDELPLSRWRFTDRVRIEAGARSHSHPVLTLGTGYPGKTAVLSSYVHEQVHWFSAALPRPSDEYRREITQRYPSPAVGAPEGADDLFSTYLHLHVCFVEFMALSELKGEGWARAFLPGIPYYRWVYRTVLDDTDSLRELFTRHDMLP